MARRRTYRPQILQNSADITRADTCDTRRSMNPLTGIWPACASVPGYRYASPDGEKHHPAAIAHCSLYILHCSYFGSRYYSSDLSVWLSVDPMSGKYPSLSPYTYCADNPVKLVDPNGEEISTHTDENGNVLAVYNDGQLGIFVHTQAEIDAFKKGVKFQNDVNQLKGHTR